MGYTQKFKLPEPFRSDWIKALRSGKYKQGKKYMYNSINENYCCLGVAEIISGNDCEIIQGKYYSYDLASGKSKVPDVLKKYRMKGSLSDTLSRMNDTNVDFNKIADWLEENTESE